jgi:CP family cyanate transporter-like MFS transporter
LALGLFAIIGLPLSLTIPPLAVRPGWSPYLVAASAVCGVAGVAGLLLAPGWMPFLWVAFLGCAPLTFHLSLTLIGQRTRDHRGALEVSGFVNTMGYLFAAAAPVLVGLVFEITGGWTMALIAIGVVMLLQIPAIRILAREAIVEDELSTRA